jgi:hypothetical protein
VGHIIHLAGSYGFAQVAPTGTGQTGQEQTQSSHFTRESSVPTISKGNEQRRTKTSRTRERAIFGGVGGGGVAVAVAAAVAAVAGICIERRLKLTYRFVYTHWAMMSCR